MAFVIREKGITSDQHKQKLFEHSPNAASRLKIDSKRKGMMIHRCRGNICLGDKFPGRADPGAQIKSFVVAG